MFVVVGRVHIKPGQEDLTRQMVTDHGVGMFRAMNGAQRAYWSRPVDDAAPLVQHSFWVFETEEDARTAAGTFSLLREAPDAPAVFVSCDVCEVIGEA
jgi:hypothetical protein